MQLENQEVMKKMYKNPEIEIAEIAPQTIICASVGGGDQNVSSNIPGTDPIPVD